MSKIKNGGLDQYGAKRFGILTFATIRKKCGTERVRSYRLGCIQETRWFPRISLKLAALERDFYRLDNVLACHSDQANSTLGTTLSVSQF